MPLGLRGDLGMPWDVRGDAAMVDVSETLEPRWQLLVSQTAPASLGLLKARLHWSTGAKPQKAAMVCHGFADGLNMLQSVKEKLLEKEKAKAASNINMDCLCASPSMDSLYSLL